MKTKVFQLNELNAHPTNPRRGDVEAIKASLEAFGQTRTIVVNLGTITGRPNEVLAGAHTLLAAKALGLKTLTGTLVDFDDDTAARVLAADNRTADRGTYDNAALAKFLEGLESLDGTGYDAITVDALLAKHADLGGSTSELFRNLIEGDPGSASNMSPAPLGQEGVPLPSPREAPDYVQVAWAVTVADRHLITQAIKARQARDGLETAAEALVSIFSDSLAEPSSPTAEDGVTL